MGIQRRGLLWESTVPLTASQVRAWHTTPIEAAPAPGPNRIIVPKAYQLFLTAGTVPFADVALANPTLVWALGGSTRLSVASLSVLFSAATSQYTALTQPTVTTHPLAADTNTSLISTLSVDLAAGAIAAATLNAAGLGYAANDTGTVDPNNNGSATYRVLTVGALGVVVTFSITAGGYGYSVANGLDTDASGAGSGFKVNVTSITPGNGSVRMVTLYTTPQVS